MDLYEKSLPVVRSAAEAREWFSEHSTGSVRCEEEGKVALVASSFVEAEKFFNFNNSSTATMRDVEHWTKEQWKNFVSNNSGNSYSLVVCLAILELYESQPDRSKDGECDRVLIGAQLGLSGAQAAMAIGFYMHHEVDGLPDPEMAAVSGPVEDGEVPQASGVSTPEDRLKILLEGVQSNPEKVAERFEDFLRQRNVGSASPEQIAANLVDFFRGYS